MKKYAKFLLPLLFLPASASAHAFVGQLVDAIVGATNWFYILMYSILITLASVFMTAAIIVVPLAADVALIVTAMLLPLALALWSVNKSWAMNAAGAMIAATLIKATCGFFLEVLIGRGGVLQSAVESVRQEMTIAWSQGQTPELTLVIGSLLGILIVMIIMTLIIPQLPGYVKAIFGGFTASADPVGAVKKVISGK